MHYISIIVPCYNQAQYLDDCLQSVLDQTYQDWECIIVNDGSLDNTEIIASVWTARDPRFKYIYKENGGLSSARNAGIERAFGEFILPLDADDTIGVDYCFKAMEAFNINPNLKVVYCQAVKFGEEEGIWNLPTFSRMELFHNNMIFCSAFFRKKEWVKVGGYDTRMIYGYEDWEFWIAILKNEGDVKCLEYIGFHYRIKKDSMLKQLDEMKITFLENLIRTKHLDFVMFNYNELQALNNRLRVEILESNYKLKSEKFVINLFLETFFGFKLFS